MADRLFLIYRKTSGVFFRIEKEYNHGMLSCRKPLFDEDLSAGPLFLTAVSYP